MAARRNHAYLHNNYSDDMVREDGVAKSNREIIVARRYPHFFTEPGLDG